MAEKKEQKAAPAQKKKEKKIHKYVAGKNCPKCGPGHKLADHKNRVSCGKCGYYEKK